MIYDSFGQVTSETNAANGDRFKYAGMEYDATTGQYYDRARYYDEAIGRFMRQDPMGFHAGDKNLYRYVGNGPTNATDPSGLVYQVSAGSADLQIFPGVLDRLAYEGTITWGFNDFTPTYVDILTVETMNDGTIILGVTAHVGLNYGWPWECKATFNFSIDFPKGINKVNNISGTILVHADTPQVMMNSFKFAMPPAIIWNDTVVAAGGFIWPSGIKPPPPPPPPPPGIIPPGMV